MPEDPPARPPVSARAVLAALAEVKRRGQWRLLQTLEREEPELAGHVLEELSLVQRRCWSRARRPTWSGVSKRQVQSLVLVCSRSERRRRAPSRHPSRTTVTKTVSRSPRHVLSPSTSNRKERHDHGHRA
jgi:hypothetical protein